MLYKYIYFDDIRTNVQYSLFSSYNKVDELHVIISLDQLNDTFCNQKDRLLHAEKRLNSVADFNNASLVFKRFFLSDAVNQELFIDKDPSCCISSIQQPPLNGTKIAVWLYYVKNVDVKHNDNTFFYEHNGYTHLWNLGMLSGENDSYCQTKNILENYTKILNTYNVNIKDNCVRTWFYVRDVDIQYMPMVVARREFFENNSMTKDSHFIASTGIGGVPASPKSIIQFGAYAIKGLKNGQQTYIKALSHLNPTHQYGVTFERGTIVHFGDRDHIVISGTASINNKGEVLHSYDIEKQTLRMWENVDALLKEANASFDEVMQIIVYLRDFADYAVVKKMFDDKFPQTPYLITLAPVCRPNWLIEMECVAVKKANNNFADF